MSLLTLRLKASAALLTSILLSSCGSGTEPDPGPGPNPVTPVPTELRIVATGDLSDTVLAPIDTLTVRLTDQNAQPIAGANVRFDVRNAGFSGTQLWIVDRQAEVLTLSVATQADGRATALVRRGTTAGEAAVTVSHSGLRDSVKYVTLPGAPYSLSAVPVDTGLYVGSSFVPRVAMFDQHGNASSHAPTLVLPTPGLVSVDGPSVRAEAFGYAPVIATYGALADTIWVAVVPRGTIAAHNLATNLIVTELDGTGRDTLALAACSGGWMVGGVRWAPGGAELVYHASMNAGGSEFAIHLVKLTGECRRVSEPTAWHTNPAFSPDRAWIYVNVTVFASKSEVWRMRPDGSELSRIGAEATGTDRDIWPQISPDGRTLSFWTTRAPGGLGLIDLATGGFSILPIQAEAPRWSPLGDLIAYIRDARLRVARPDMSGERTLGNADVEPSLHQYYDWSPDGEWIIRAARPGPGLVLVRTSDGLMIPLKYLAGLQSPAWRPCPGAFC